MNPEQMKAGFLVGTVSREEIMIVMAEAAIRAAAILTGAGIKATDDHMELAFAWWYDRHTDQWLIDQVREMEGL